MRAGAEAGAAHAAFQLKQEHAEEKARLVASHKAEREALIAEHRRAMSELSAQLRAAAASAASAEVGHAAATPALVHACYSLLRRVFGGLGHAHTAIMCPDCCLLVPRQDARRPAALWTKMQRA